MKREQALKIVKKELIAKYGTQLAASKAIGISHIQISRVMNGVTDEISPQLLELAGLEIVPQPPTTYRRKEK